MMQTFGFYIAPFLPYWLPIIALIIFWRKIQNKIAFLIIGILAASGIQHHFSFMKLWAIANGAILFDSSSNLTAIAIDVIILAIPGFILSSMVLYWLANALKNKNEK